MEIVKYGSLMHGRWVGAWQVGWCMVGDFQSTTLIRFLGSFSSPRRCILAWMSSSKLQPVVSLKISNLNHVIWTFRTSEKCQKHCTYLKLGCKNVFPNSDQLVASEACLKRHLLTKWSSVKLDIWVLSLQWSCFSSKGGLQPTIWSNMCTLPRFS